jgi:hypothetical protein
MPKRKKAHELTTEEVLKRVFHPHVRKRLKKKVQELDRERPARGKKPQN